MARRSKKSHTALLVLGGVAVAGVAYYFYNKSAQAKAIANGPSGILTPGSMASGITSIGQFYTPVAPSGGSLVSVTDSAGSIYTGPVSYGGTPAIGSGSTWLTVVWKDASGTQQTTTITV